VLVPPGDTAAHAERRRRLRAFPRRRCVMTPIAPHITAFFHKRLAVDQGVSQHTYDLQNGGLASTPTTPTPTRFSSCSSS
jgi:hypothetical protein